jgi:hypothetical protein
MLVWTFARQCSDHIPHHVFAYQLPKCGSAPVVKRIKFDLQTVAAKLLGNVVGGVIASVIGFGIIIKLNGITDSESVSASEELTGPPEVFILDEGDSLPKPSKTIRLIE